MAPLWLVKIPSLHKIFFHPGIYSLLRSIIRLLRSWPTHRWLLPFGRKSTATPDHFRQTDILLTLVINFLVLLWLAVYIAYLHSFTGCFLLVSSVRDRLTPYGIFSLGNTFFYTLHFIFFFYVVIYFLVFLCPANGDVCCSSHYSLQIYSQPECHYCIKMYLTAMPKWYVIKNWYYVFVFERTQA